MTGHRFTRYVPVPEQGKGFGSLLRIFLQLLTYTSGDATEALDWMHQLDREYGLTGDEYGMADFLQELQDKGYLRADEQDPAVLMPTARAEQGIRQQSLEEIFGKLKRDRPGQHPTPHTGQQGQDYSSDIRPYDFGDDLAQIRLTESLRNAQVNHGIEDLHLQQNDLVVTDREYAASTATVLMLDISHSMILYGEDRITPAKQVAMALSELIARKYPKDKLDIIVFGNDAWPVEVKDLPYLQVGPYHTNTVAGLELAMNLLRRHKVQNKQIFMITDGKPTCLKERDGSYYKNSWGLDRRILNKTLTLAAEARRLRIPITTFMIAQDPWLVRFVREFTETNAGRAFYSGLNGLGQYVFEDFARNKRKNVR
ncbi:MAG: hypothetical protein KF690_10230 [Bacteroidetes bacterium]|nr:hypothetical protein [Bacteroidota bacterium]